MAPRLAVEPLFTNGGVVDASPDGAALRISPSEESCPAGWGCDMTRDIDWGRYAVVHWTVNRLLESGALRPCGQTRAFAELAQAVLFTTGLDREHRQTARVDCGGRTYQAVDIERLTERSDFPHRRELAEA
jgi:hypothetical protein